MNSTSKRSPIGVFDSGIGGLTVVKSLIKLLPMEHILYFGDTARVPYGIKSMDTVKEYAIQITDYLLKKEVKMVIIACNTVAAAAEHAVRERCGSVPVLDVVEAGTRLAVQSVTHKKLIGVIGTLATIGSGTYEKSIQKRDNDIKVYSKACPLLVPLAEEGWIDNEVAMKTIELYLSDFSDKELDALIMGCTHYPLFRDGIARTINGKTKIIDSADAVAEMTKDYLEKNNLINDSESGSFECFVSDKPQRFQQLAERFLGQSINRVEIVNLKI